MKIKQIGTYDGDIISTILKNRQVENVDLFLHPTNDNDLDPFKLSNMKAGAEVLIAHLLIDNEIGLLVDPDADGLTSASMIYQYIKKIHPEAKITYFLHDTKAHGLTDKIMNQISGKHIDLMVIPDAASNDDTEIQKLYYMGMDIVIIDHHEIDKYPKYGVLINNQANDNEETNHNLVGAGMVLKFCQALDQMLKVDYSKEFYDLAAIGQIGDGSDISENEIRYLVFQGLRQIKNPFVETVLKESFENFDEIAPVDLSFSIIPLINAVVRVGTMEEKELLFRALNSINADETWTIPKKKKNKVTGKFDTIQVTMNLYEFALDTFKKVKARQANMVKKAMATLDKGIDNSGGIAIGILPTSKEGSVTGLIANKIVGKYKKPALIVHHVDGKYVGSGRGYEKTLDSLKDWCQETELVEMAQGHANAFGISIVEEDFEAFKDKMKEIRDDEFVYEVDLHLIGRPDKNVILETTKYRRLFGGKVHEPIFAFTNIKVNKSFIRKRGSVLTFFDNGVEFIMFDAPEGLYEELTQNFERFITMDFVGRPSVSTWGGKTTPQLILVDCERTKEEAAPTKEVTAENIVF